MPPVDETTGAFSVPTRDSIAEQYRQSVRIRLGADAETGDGTFYDSEAKVEADTLLPIYADAAKAGNGVSLKNRTRSQLEQELEDMGLASPIEATGASGYVKISASVGGGFIAYGTELTNDKTKIRFRCTLAGTYFDGDPCPVEGIDRGTQTNQDAGTVLKWSSPPAGISSSATVIEQADGTGLSGGHAAETDAQIVDRIRRARRYPAASGNDAEIVAEVYRTKNVPIEYVFTYPAVKGSGTTGVVFTVQSNTTRDSRLPSSPQLTAVQQQLALKFPKDFGIMVCTLTHDYTDIALRVQWAPGVDAWVDQSPWPTYNASNPVAVQASPAPTVNTFRLADGSPHLSAPSSGMTIGVWSASKLKFFNKRISTVTVVSPGVWDIVCDTSNNASDLTYVPVAGDQISPWSDSLNTLAQVVIDYMATNGPGEQLAILTDDDDRERRNPRAEEAPLAELDERMLNPIFDSLLVARVVAVEPTFPKVPTVGSAGVNSYINRLRYLRVFPT